VVILLKAGLELAGDCSIRVGGLGFSREEIDACAARRGLLSIELDLSAERCECAACLANPAADRSPLTVIEIADLLQQAQNEGARRVIFCDAGEPSHPALRQMIDSARHMGMEVELFAYSTPMSSSMAGFLRERNVSVVVKWEKLMRAGNSAGEDTGGTGWPRLAAAIGVTEENIGEVPAMWRKARARGIEPYVQIIKPGRNGAGSVVSPERAKALFEELGQIDLEEFGKRWEKPAALIGRSCKRHQFACHVTACGTIFACVGVTIPLGNVRSESLHEILELSEVLENLRAYPEKMKEPCRTCSKTTDCYGCRGAAYQLTGDYLAADQMCWKINGKAVERLPIAAAGLVPHGESMRMVDELIDVGERTAKTIFTVREDCVLVDSSGRLDELAFVEMIAQSFAVCHGYHLTEDERLRHRGLLLGVKELNVASEARVGDRLTVHLRKVTRFGAFGVVEGDVFRDDGTLVASGQVKIWRPGDEIAAEMGL
jgi:radical SAM protein with 4Fe4S-binding SPASM domain